MCVNSGDESLDGDRAIFLRNGSRVVDRWFRRLWRVTCSFAGLNRRLLGVIASNDDRQEKKQQGQVCTLHDFGLSRNMPPGPMKCGRM
jgi:hypothetical protein